MDGGKFSAMLAVIVPPVVGLISTREGQRILGGRYYDAFKSL